MFSVLDAANGLPAGRPKTSADRACDQCKARKVRCDMGRSCGNCAKRSITCTYNDARKKRGPPPGRIAKIEKHMLAEHDVSDTKPRKSSSLASRPSPTSTILQDVPVVSVLPEHLSPNRPSPQARTQSVTSWPYSHQDEPTMSVEEVDFIFPSLPVVSPSGELDLFSGLPQAMQAEPLAAGMPNVWPGHINQETLMPWIDVYFKRLHPTVPVLNRSRLYHDMLLGKHRTSPQYGSMLLSLCAFAMTQPIEIHEVTSAPSRSAQARMLIEESVKMRVSVDFGEAPTLEMVLTSFFLFACLFGSNKHRAARHRLREAVDLAHALGLHLPHSYDGLTLEEREQWLRTYLVLSVTERAYGIQKRHSIEFRGSPAVSARFMQAFDPILSAKPSTTSDDTDRIGMTGLLYLMDTFDAIDEDVIQCWNGQCKFIDNVCAFFDRRQAIKTFKAQHRMRESCLAGTISFAPPSTSATLAMHQLQESQQADISITQFWLLNRLWNLCLSHGLLKDISEVPELQFDFPCSIGLALIATCNKLPLPAMEAHGVGFVDKVYDVALGIITALQSSSTLTLDRRLSDLAPGEVISGVETNAGEGQTVRNLLQGFETFTVNFRSGTHDYSVRLSEALGGLPGYYGWPSTNHIS